MHIDGLMLRGRNPIADALELRLFCIKPPMYISRFVFRDSSPTAGAPLLTRFNLKPSIKK